MGFLDDLGKKVSDAGQKTIQKTKEVSDTVRINSLIAEEEKKINNMYFNIGKTYVDLHGNDCCEEAFVTMVKSVVECDQKIKEYKEQLQDVKGIQRCEKCGFKVAKNATFCSSCGSQIQRIRTLEEMGNLVECEYCGAVMKKDVHFCTACGKQMYEKIASDLASVSFTLQKDEHEKICPGCGMHQGENATFCINCGAQL